MTFREPKHVGRPNVGDVGAFIARAKVVLETRWLSNHGPMVGELEARIAALLGVRHCIAVSNATAGLEVLAHALELRGQVIVPSFTFIASAHALRWVGLEPVFCDIDPRTHLLDVAAVERLIDERTSAVLGVHLWGQPCAVDELGALCRARGLKLIFDAAHAFSCSRAGRPLAGFGAAEVFSFHATKFFNSAEGGAITTDDDTLAERVRLAINFGFEDTDRVVALGTNAKMSELHAALGLTNLDALDDFVAANLRNHRAYARRLESIPGLRLLHYRPEDTNNHQYVVVEVEPQPTGRTRDQVVAYLQEHNVLARRYFTPGCHRSEPYASRPGGPPLLPVTDAICARAMTLPTGACVSESDVEAICDLIERALTKGPG